MSNAVAAHGTGTFLAPWPALELIPAIPATTLEGGRPFSPLKAPGFDANGDAFIVWTEQSGAFTETAAPEYRVRAALRPAGGGWQPAETLSRLGLNPEVTVDARGDAIAAWEGRLGVEAAIKPLGGGWGSPQIVGTPRGEEPQEPQVASDASGGAIVVAPVQAHGKGSTGIRAAVRPAGGSFSAPRTISHDRELALDPQIAMNARGDAIVAWDAQVASGCLVRAAFRSAGGDWGAPRTVPDGHEVCRGNHQVAIDERGNAIVAWAVMRGSTVLVKAAAREARGRWIAQPVIGRVSAVVEPAGAPHVGMDARGDAIVVWEDAAPVLGGRRTIWARIHPVGRRWGAKERIGEVTYESAASFAMNARGDASIVWEDRRGIELASHLAGGRWQKPTTVSDRKGAEVAFQATPVVALGARGDGIVAWESDRYLKTGWHAAPLP
ncbi:MAG TPA: hypothetical protein VGO40_04145 [Longimicrobium sp.]|nr:hypothetical protein [Longimicrobium sp.]